MYASTFIYSASTSIHSASTSIYSYINIHICIQKHIFIYMNIYMHTYILLLMLRGLSRSIALSFSLPFCVSSLCPPPHTHNTLSAVGCGAAYCCVEISSALPLSLSLFRCCSLSPPLSFPPFLSLSRTLSLSLTHTHTSRSAVNFTYAGRECINLCSQCMCVCVMLAVSLEMYV